ncbi:MAG TPA: hypothetical protein PKM88_14890 [bacterium]|nr:hypothetical protein [bacterium]
MADVSGVIDLELTSDDPLEFVGEVARLKLALIDREIMREIAATGAGSREVQALLAARRAFQDMLARLGIAATGVTAPAAEPAVTGSPAAEPAAPAADEPNAREQLWQKRGRLQEQIRKLEETAGSEKMLALLATELNKVNGQLDGGSFQQLTARRSAAGPAAGTGAKRQPPAAQHRAPASAAAGPARPAGKISLTERLLREEAAAPPPAARRPVKVVVADDTPAPAGVPGAGMTAGGTGSAPALATRLPRQQQRPTLNIEAVESIEKKAKEDGYLDTREMLWLKRGRLHEQIRKAEETGGEGKMLVLLKNELDKVNYLLDGGLEKVKAAGISAQAEKKAAARHKIEKKQEELRAELSGLFDEINSGDGGSTI